VIARPFLGEGPADFHRSAGRHDFSLPPTSPTILDTLVDAGVTVFGVGKIRDIYAGRGITGSISTNSNDDGMSKTLQAMAEIEKGLIFTNLVDFDMLFGHRLDSSGFGRALEAFDRWLPRLQEKLFKTDLLLITADHGCDPTTPGTDHTRESVPLLAWQPLLKHGKDFGTRTSFADVAATIAEFFAVESPAGESILAYLDGEGEGRAAGERTY
jgi:phosphopentomutase